MRSELIKFRTAEADRTGPRVTKQFDYRDWEGAQAFVSGGFGRGRSAISLKI